jgi:UPF0176 protein
MKTPIESRHARIFEVTHPLPGSLPRDSFRPLNVPERFDRLTLLDFLDAFHPHYGREYWGMLCAEGRILCKRIPVRADRVVRGGEQFEQLLLQTVEPDVNADIRILYEDESIVVVRKPAPLPMHPCGRFNRNTLSSILDQVYSPRKPLLIHRLDANTSGLVVLGLERSPADLVRQQFERREVKKVYLARVHGRPESEAFASDTRISESPCEAGARLPDPKGLEARTEFRLVADLGDETALVEARPITGRTNQIRLHLWDLGHAIVGDPVYLSDGKMGRTQTLSVGDPPLCLHAIRIELTHPATGERVAFEDERPGWSVIS